MTAALRALAVTLALLGAGSALAHEGHDHGAAPPPVTKSIAPRGEAASAAFELVAVPREGTLTLYLDRFQTGAPIANATLTVETPTGPVTAQAAEPGIYRLPPGSASLAITTCWSRSPPAATSMCCRSRSTCLTRLPQRLRRFLPPRRSVRRLLRPCQP
jgi:hypothetical protein